MYDAYDNDPDFQDYLDSGEYFDGMDQDDIEDFWED